VNLGQGEFTGALYLGTVLLGQPGTTVAYSLPHPVAETHLYDPFVGSGLDASVPKKDQTATQHINGVGTVTGTAYDDSGHVGAGLPITLSGAMGYSAATTTDTDGSYSFTDVPTGKVTVYAASGVGPSPSSGPGQSSGYLRTDGGTVQVDLYSPDRCDLAGTLFDYGGSPVADFDVSFNSYFNGDGVTTDGGGGFAFPGIQPDTGWLWAGFCDFEGAEPICTEGFRNFGIGACPGGGATVEYDLPMYRIQSDCGGSRAPR
jgi:hypothetical protein